MQNPTTKFLSSDAEATCYVTLQEGSELPKFRY